jgi:hypothetical protein
LRTKLPRYDENYSIVVEAPQGKAGHTATASVGKFFTKVRGLQLPREAWRRLFAGLPMIMIAVRSLFLLRYSWLPSERHKHVVAAPPPLLVQTGDFSTAHFQAFLRSNVLPTLATAGSKKKQ